MSLLQRVGSTESRERFHGSPGPAARRLSFNPVGGPSPQREPIAAYEVPTSKRIAQIVAASIYCLFAAGIIFGYAAVKQVLIAEGVYRDRCTKEELERHVTVCYDQEFNLNLMFTIGAVVTNVSALPIGTLLDRYGPRVCGLTGAFFVAVGCLLMAFAKEMPGDGYKPGYVFLALGGPFIFISSFQLSNTFPKYSGSILALLTGAFDTSSVIFLLYRLLYGSSDGGIPLKQFFLIYLIVPIYIVLVQIFLMPKNSYKTVSELVQKAQDEADDTHYEASNSATETHEQRQTRRESILSEITSLLGTHDGSDQNDAEERKKQNSGVWGALHGLSAIQQIKTPWWLLIAGFTVVQMLRINYFIATIRPQYIEMINSPAARRINGVFDVALPLGGVVAVPFVGGILDHTSTPFVLALLVALATLIGVLGVIPNEGAAYANVILFCLYRPFYYTTVSDYTAKVFGFHTFGKVYGLIICLAGLCNFIQAGLDAATHESFHGNPIPINIILLVVALGLGMALVAYVWFRSRSIKREMLEQEAEDARPLIMPGADDRVREDRHTVDVHGYGTRDTKDYLDRGRKKKGQSENNGSAS